MGDHIFMKTIRIILYLSLAFVGVLLWNAWQQNQAALSAQAASTEQSSAATLSSTSPLSSGITQSANSVLPPAMVPSTSPVSTQPSSEKLVNITTDVLKLSIDPTKGMIVNAGLLAYPVSKKTPDQPFVLFNTKPDTYYVAQTGLTNLPGLGNNPIPFTSTQAA